MKKVSAPLTYKPSGNRPKEHLAYLNKSEMKALRRLNGNNIERGPSGLPSFPPADAQGSSSKASSSKTSSKSSGSSSVSRISGGSSGSNAARSASNAASSSRSPSGGGRDSGQASSSRGNVSSSRNGINSIPTSRTVNVGPMGTPVKVGVSRGAYPITRMPNIEAPTEKMPESIRNFVSRNALMLDPMSKYTDPSWSQNVANSMDPGFSGGQIFSGLGNFFSPSNITKSIYDAGTGLIKSGVDVASDPYGSLKKGIGSIGDYLKGSFDLMSNAAMGDEASVGPAFMRSLDLPIAGNMLGTVPDNSLASIIGRRSSIPEINTAMGEAENFISQYGKLNKNWGYDLDPIRQRQLFEETAKRTPSWASGVQELVPGTGIYGIEVNDPFTYRPGVDSGMLKQSMKPIPLSQIIERGPTIEAYNQLADMPIRLNPQKVGGSSVGGYYDEGWGRDYRGPVGLGRYMKDELLGPPRGSFEPAVEVNLPFGKWSPDNEYVKTLAHEVGGHGTLKEAGIKLGSLGPSTYKRLIGNNLPTIAKKDVGDLAYRAYRNQPEEAISFKVEDSLGLPDWAMKDFDARFGNRYSPNEIKEINNTRLFRDLLRTKAGNVGFKIP